MKILWFTNTPCSASSMLNSDFNVGGWLISLEKELIKLPDIELHISFYSNKKIDKFKFEGTFYHPIFRSPLIKLKRKINIESIDTKYEIPILLSVISEINPDIIHIHGTEENFGLIQKSINIPVVISIQGILTAYCAKYFSGIPKSAVYKYESIFRLLSLKSYIYNYHVIKKLSNREKAIYSSSKYLIGRTNWDRRIAYLFAPKAKYFFCNEILRNSFYNKKWANLNILGKNDNYCYSLVTIMSGGLYKGLEFIFQVAKLLDTCKIKYKWSVIGPKENDPITILVHKFIGNNYSNNIILLGNKSEIEISDLLVNSDLYCQVSHIENSPNSLCEALIIGLPSIATYAGGTSTLLEDSIDGILVQDGDAFAYSGAIVEFLKNFNSLANKFSISSRNKALCRHDKYKIINNVISIYKYVINDFISK